MKILSIAAVLVTFTAATSHAISELPAAADRFSCASDAAAQHQVPANILLAVLDGADTSGGCQSYDQAAMRIKHEIATGHGDLWQRIARYRPERRHTSRKELATRSGLWADKLGLYRLNGLEGEAEAIGVPATQAKDSVLHTDPIDQAFEQPVPGPPAESRVSISLPVASEAASPTRTAPHGGTIRVGLQSGLANQVRKTDATGQLISTRNLVQHAVEGEVAADQTQQRATGQVKNTADVATRRVTQDVATASQAGQDRSLHTDAAASQDVPRDDIQAEVPDIAAAEPARKLGDQHLRWQPLARKNSIQGILSAYHAELFVHSQKTSKKQQPPRLVKQGQAQKAEQPARQSGTVKNAPSQAVPATHPPAEPTAHVAVRSTKNLRAPEATLQATPAPSRAAQHITAPAQRLETAATTTPSAYPQKERKVSNRKTSAPHTAPLQALAESGWEPRKRSETMDKGLYQTALKF